VSVLKLGERVLSLDTPVIMGVLNVTPDSFSDGGLYTHAEAALKHAQTLVAEGARIIDVGGESTRPGATRPALATELARVVPVIELLAQHLDVIISVDTSRAEVMRAAVQAGACLVNDVRGFREPHTLTTCAALNVGVAIMHMQGEPSNMQINPRYAQVGPEVAAYLAQQTQACLAAGIAPESILWDPGFGFGKTHAHNAELFAYLPTLAQAPYPLLIGVSRKSWVGHLTAETEPQNRVSGSVALALLACQRGARVIRTHDVKATAQALRVYNALALAP